MAIKQILSFIVLSFIFSTLAISDEKQTIRIAYLVQKHKIPPTLSNLDPYIADKGLQGALLGIKDNNTTGQFTGQTFDLQVVEIPIDGDPLAVFKQIDAEDFQFILLNIPAKDLIGITTSPLVRDKLFFDIATRDDDLRYKYCQPAVLHMLPSRAMRADALAQYMLKKRWQKWFLVVGPTENDRLYAEALKRSAKRFGMKVVAEKTWEHDYDARRTAQSEVPVFTQGVDYDVLVVADEADLFAEYLSYRTWKPRPVIGTQGLVATSWHRTHEQWGAVQIQNRFKEQAARWMEEEDYAAYLAIRSIGEAATRTRQSDRLAIHDYLLSEDFALQGYKGKPLSFRIWNGQLRQPVLLAAARSMVSHAPLEGFLHPINEMDSLGYDRPEMACNGDN